VMELLGRLSRFIDRAGGQGLEGLDLVVYLVGYYAQLLPVTFLMITPYVTVIACMFAASRLLNANEVVPMLFVGRSTQRILRPMLLCGACAGVAMAACWQWVMPHLGATLAEYESVLNQGSPTHKCLVDESAKGSIYIREYDPREGTWKMSDVAMFNEGVLAADNTLVTAPAANWDATRRDWRLEKGLVKRGRKDLPREWLERPDLTPDVLLQRSRETVVPDTLSYTELLETMALRPNRELRLALHRHITYPLANLVLLLLALPLAVSFERGGRIGRLLAAIGLCLAYMMFDLACQNLGRTGLVHPVVAAWSPTIVFGALGVVLFGSART